MTAPVRLLRSYPLSLHDGYIASSSSSRWLHLMQGSVTDFQPRSTTKSVVNREECVAVDDDYSSRPQKAAIVNAANPGCLSGGGVDGAITMAGGPNLAQDRLALPIILDKFEEENLLAMNNNDHQNKNSKNRSSTNTSTNKNLAIRCRPGYAVITGPNDYDQLHASYVIHAVGPNYWDYQGHEQEVGHPLLSSAYNHSLHLAEQHMIEQIAFPLLSAGVYRGPTLTIQEILKVSIQAILDWSSRLSSNPSSSSSSLRDIYLFGYTNQECQALQVVCDQVLQSK